MKGILERKQHKRHQIKCKVYSNENNTKDIKSNVREQNETNTKYINCKGTERN